MKIRNNWVFFVSGRFGRADSRGRSALTSALSISGIALGVTALIVILAVMNGFQMGYIESILEVSSAHVRLTGSREDIERARALPGVRSLTVFADSQILMEGGYNRQSGVLLRAIPPDMDKTDVGFGSSVRVVSGRFDIGQPNTVLLGYELAQALSVGLGDPVSVVAVSGDASTDLFPENATLTVTGLFKTGYYAIDNSFAFVSTATGATLTGEATTGTAAVKLENVDRDADFIAELSRACPNVQAESWRSYNRAFFGALRVEKNMMLFLVVLIFLVVGVNIHNAMRRAVYERKEEISVLTALGATPARVQGIFLANGLGIGVSGGLVGLLCGLFISTRINGVFHLAEVVVNGANAFASSLLGLPPGQSFSIFSPEYFYLDKVPVRLFFPEVLFIFLFGVLSATVAAWSASRNILKLKPAEVLRYE